FLICCKNKHFVAAKKRRGVWVSGKYLDGAVLPPKQPQSLAAAQSFGDQVLITKRLISFIQQILVAGGPHLESSDLGG
ncbi:hypothetical protein V4Y02_23975, partial [Escherichia coli]